MKKTFLFKALAYLLCQLLTAQLSAQVEVGTLLDGEPTLSINEAELSNKLAFVLNGATLRQATLWSGKDSQGVYYFIKAIGARAGQAAPSQIAVVLSQNGDKFVFDAETDCVMEAIPQAPCPTCDLTINERCKQLSCACSTSAGGCTVRVVIP